LRPVFETLNFTPSLIIFIDDKRENLESVSLALQKSYPSIEFIGIHYFAMDTIEAPITQEQIFRQKLESLIQQTIKITS